MFAIVLSIAVWYTYPTFLSVRLCRAIFHPIFIGQSIDFQDNKFTPFAQGNFLLFWGSAFYHASLTFVGQFFDVMGMYFIASFIMLYNISRLKSLNGKNFYKKLPFTLSISPPGILILFLYFLPLF
jgi:hypothetical protein